MTYSTPIIKGRFISRPNRFIALVDVEGEVFAVHVKNTGRCRELLLPDSAVYLAASANPARKTPYDLVAVEKIRPDGTTVTVNMDSQAANDIAAEWLPVSGLFSADVTIRREVTHGDSRVDFCIHNANGEGSTAYLEVKGCTLERDGLALFPDAPTERGVKHIRELMALAEQGNPAYILFVIQMKGIHSFRPNDETHKAFGDALREAHEAGVKVLAVDCVIRLRPAEDGTFRLSVTADASIPVIL